MKALKNLTLGLAASALFGCASSNLPDLAARRGHCERDDRLVGSWTTKISMSQLGPGFETVTYNCDCTYTARSWILLLIIPIRGTETGWYNASNGELVTVGGQFSSRMEARYHFDGKTLVVQQGAEPERFSNVRHPSCKDKTLPPVR
ncbi:MAG TPA: hypothetical protein VGG20_04335 [Thermoanaerobaculia bacterium]|jgi:hypothetical protein